MSKSIFFRRTLSLLLLALLLWAILTVLMYSFISRPVFTRIKVAELQPKAELVAKMASQSFLVIDPNFDSLMTSAFDFFDVWIFVVDGISGEIRNTSLPETETAAEPTINSLISKNMPTLMSGDFASLWFTSRIQQSEGKEEMLFVGVPVTLQFGRQTGVVGAVFFATPLAEINAGRNSLNLALLFSSLLVFLLMVVPTYRATARLIRPLRQTRDVALAMAEGNFSVRANASRQDEIGELATTMNNLAAKLEDSISALTQERNRLRQIIEGMNEGLIAADKDCRITQTNQAAGVLLGLTNPAEPMRDLTQLPDQIELVGAFHKAIAENTEVSLILERCGCSIMGQVAPLSDSENTVTGAVGLFRDVTEAEHLEQTRRDYVANVSHELRTPLTAMRALVEPLRDGLVQNDADRQRYYGIMLREIVRLSRLINDMLELSRLQAGTSPMAMTTLDLSQLIRDLEARMRVQFEDIDLEMALPANLDRCPLVLGNSDRIEQVLIILLDNAIKYTPSGGQVSIQLDWNDSQVFISVADTGIGIAAEDLGKVFDRFYKADKAHQQPGTGLGLAIAREILQRMGQTIKVRSELGHGTIFTFTLNRANSKSFPESI